MKAWKPSCSASFTCSRKRTLVSSPSEQTDTLMVQASKHYCARKMASGTRLSSPRLRGEGDTAMRKTKSRPGEGTFPQAQTCGSAPSPAALRASTSPRKRGEVRRGAASLKEPSFLVDAAQPAIGRVGFRPLARIGAINALGEIGADGEIDRHVDDPGPAAGDGLAQGRPEQLGVLDAGAFGAVGVGELDVIGIVALAGVLAGEGAPRMRALVGTFHAFALDAELVIVEDHPDGRQLVFDRGADRLIDHVERAVAGEHGRG